MKITEIVPADVAGYCDIETGECVVAAPEPAGDRSAETAPEPPDAALAQPR